VSFNAQLNPLKMFLEKIQQTIGHKNVLKQQAQKWYYFTMQYSNGAGTE